MTTRYFAWIDLESTGLHANKGHILEVACVITDHQLEPIRVFNQVVKPPFYVRMFPHRWMDDFVFNMHSNNKLLDECKYGANLKDTEDSFYKFLKPYRDSGAQELYFVGNSISALDLPFLREHMPRVMELAHYRSLDISGLRLGLEQIFNNQNGFYVKLKTKTNHRALDDVYRSIEQLKSYKNKIGKIVQGAIDIDKTRHTF